MDVGEGMARTVGGVGGEVPCFAGCCQGGRRVLPLSSAFASRSTFSGGFKGIEEPGGRPGAESGSGALLGSSGEASVEEEWRVAGVTGMGGMHGVAPWGWWGMGRGV